MALTNEKTDLDEVKCDTGDREKILPQKDPLHLSYMTKGNEASNGKDRLRYFDLLRLRSSIT